MEYMTDDLQHCPSTAGFNLNRWRVTADKIVDVVERIVQVANPVQVIAFGSRARGTHRPDSDLDLTVIIDSEKRPVITGLGETMPLDVLIVRKERYDFMRGSMVSVHRQIAEEGVSLYERSKAFIDIGAAARLAR